MKYMISDMLEKLDHHELMNIKQGVEKGDLDFRALVKEKIIEKERSHEKFCAVCQNDIDPGSTTTFTILFGPEGFKKKATFCAVDCLHYFIDKLKEMKC